MDDASVSLDEILSMLERREGMLRHFFSTPIEHGLHVEVRAWIQALMAVDKEAMAALALRKKSMAEQYACLRQQARSASEYQETDAL